MRASFAVFALLLTACGNPTVIDGKQYSKSCASVSECVAVVVGDQCQPCACPNAAIATSEKVIYDADRSAAQAACGGIPAIACTPCPDQRPTCELGVCGL